MNNQLRDLLELLIDFRRKRDWKQFHTPKNLAISVSIEAAELLEHFQWTKENEPILAEKKSEIEKEMADIFIYLLLMSNDLGIDLIGASLNKIKENNKKYPIEKAKGSSKKYKELI